MSTEREQRQATIIEQSTIRTVGAWPASHEDSATPRVLEASNAYVEATQRLAGADAEVAEARAAFERAVNADDASALQAAEAGRQPPKPTTDKAQAAVLAAERNATALRQLHAHAVNTYIAALIDDHGELRQRTEVKVAKETTEIGEAVETLAERLVGLSDLRLLRDALGPDADELRGHVVTFLPARTGRLLERDPLPVKVRELLLALQAEVGEQADYQTVTF